MENFDYTISIGQLGEQLTLNQWVLGSSPRWCTKKVLSRMAGDFLLHHPLRGGFSVRASAPLQLAGTGR